MEKSEEMEMTELKTDESLTADNRKTRDTSLTDQELNGDSTENTQKDASASTESKDDSTSIENEPENLSMSARRKLNDNSAGGDDEREEIEMTEIEELTTEIQRIPEISVTEPELRHDTEVAQNEKPISAEKKQDMSDTQHESTNYSESARKMLGEYLAAATQDLGGERIEMTQLRSCRGPISRERRHSAETSFKENESKDGSPSAKYKSKDSTPSAKYKSEDNSPSSKYKSKDSSPSAKDKPEDNSPSSKYKSKDSSPSAKYKSKDNSPSSEYKSKDSSSSAKNKPKDNSPSAIYGNCACMLKRAIMSDDKNGKSGGESVDGARDSRRKERPKSAPGHHSTTSSSTKGSKSKSSKSRSTSRSPRKAEQSSKSPMVRYSTPSTSGAAASQVSANRVARRQILEGEAISLPINERPQDRPDNQITIFGMRVRLPSWMPSWMNQQRRPARGTTIQRLLGMEEQGDAEAQRQPRGREESSWADWCTLL